MEKELRNLTSTLLGESLATIHENIRIHEEELLAQNEENEELKRIVATQQIILSRQKEIIDKTEKRIESLELQVLGLEALIAEADKKEKNGN